MYLSLSNVLQRLSYTLKNDPLYSILNGAIAKIQEGNFTQAGGLLKNGEKNIENKHKYYPHISGIKESYTDYKKAMNAIQAKDSETALKSLKSVLENLEKAAPEVHREQTMPTLTH